jgi:VanZ family protein
MAVCVVSVGSLLPSSSAPIQLVSGVSDKLLHFLAYVVLGLLPVLWAGRWRQSIVMVLAMVALGLALEYGQIFVPGRGFELADLVTDDAGLLCGVLVGRLGLR